MRQCHHKTLLNQNLKKSVKLVECGNKGQFEKLDKVGEKLSDLEWERSMILHDSRVNCTCVLI